MKRSSGLITLVITLVACPLLAEEPGSPRQSLADRIGALRQGWSFSTDRPEPEAEASPTVPPQRIAQRTSPVTVSDTPRAFPRVNPRELLPRNWFGVGGQASQGDAVTPAPVSEKAISSNGSVGSARARLLRDMRRSPASGVAPAEPAPRVAMRPQPRAGSALSPGAPQVKESTTAQDRVAKTIAAEVAEVMANEAMADEAATEAVPVAEESTEPQVAEAVEAAPIDVIAEGESLFTEEENRESLLPFGVIEGTTPTESADEPAALAASEGAEPQEQRSQEQSVAESDAGRVSVAARPQETAKLPLFIGGRYSQLDEGSTVEPTSPVEPEYSEENAAAESAFAARPTVTTRVEAEPAQEADDLLLTHQMPVLVSKVMGPRTIVVGREVNYRVLLANRGDVAADQVVTRVEVPQGAEVVAVKAATGLVKRDDDHAEGGQITWRADRLAAGQVIDLNLKLIARTGRPIELGVVHSHKPVDGRTLVEVQEPKLALQLVGPEEVLFGKPQSFRLTISNPGTGVAERVKLHLTPPGGEAQRQTSHDFGSIGAGEERTVEIELTAREAGELAVNASATAEGEVSAEVSKQVFCRKPELVVDWRGPEDRYAGSPAVYYFRVRNPGTAVAPGVVLNVELPAGFEVTPTAGTPAAADGKLAFRAGALRPGDDKFFELRGVLREAGTKQITLRAAASDETRSAPVTATTEVVALADLKLDVLDPKGPIATDQEVEYEIRVTNRGSSDAHDVGVVALFSAGIDPHHVEGGEGQMHDGRVAFDKIEHLGPGEQKVFTIHARAHEEGTHRFRAEVLCRDLEIKLVAEEMTRFFEDEAINVAAEGYPSGSVNSRYPR
ncbi:Large cysteine-rich periplasmic protein OmcB precursor [Planctomycetes bacterium MalM25]|nr:Large cysteine-rich periplasmic protein OmcB precursor [Planctomycetes bacterium MalM25]